MERLFTELLPAEIAARKAEGQKARILFYAHGGLIDEREGLEPVLARLKFWRQNNVYPISFVWETGLRETIMDIVDGLGATRSLAARSVGEDLADARARSGGAPGRQGRLGPDEAQRRGCRARRRRRAARRRSHARAVERSTTPISRSMPLGIAPARSSTRTSCRPCCRGSLPRVRRRLTLQTLHFLAPACTTELVQDEADGPRWPGKGHRGAHHVHDEQEPGAGRYGRAVQEVAALPREPRVRDRAAHADPRAGGKPPRRPEADSLLRPGRQPEAGRRAVLEVGARRAAAQPHDIHLARRLRRRRPDDEQRDAPGTGR